MTSEGAAQLCAMVDHGLDRMELRRALLREQRDLARQLLGPLALTYGEPKDSDTATGRRR